MVSLTAQEACAITGALLVAGNGKTLIRDVVTDNRDVVLGGTFVAFVGESVDGNGFAPQAIEAGCACVVLSREPSAELLSLASSRGVCVLRAKDDDPEAFLLRLAKAWRSRHQWLCVGITGSVGKTTTKELVVAALKDTYKVHANEGNFNSVIGVPLTILRAPEDTQVLVCEMGMNHPGEIASITEAAQPHLGVITNIGTSHIGYMGSRQAIADEKSQLISAIARSLAVPGFETVQKSIVLASADDFTPYIQSHYCEPLGVHAIRVGTQQGDDVQAENIVLTKDGHPSFTVRADQKTHPATLNLTGTQAVVDSLFALAIAQQLGVDSERALTGIQQAQPAAMRAQIKESPRGWRIIDDSYNASPASLACALDTLAALETQGRKICVIGQVGELGEASRWLHGLMGSYVAAIHPDIVCFVGGDDANTMAEAALIMGLAPNKLVLAQTTEEAIGLLESQLVPGDVLLAKGSRAVGLDRLVQALGA